LKDNGDLYRNHPYHAMVCGSTVLHVLKDKTQGQSTNDDAAYTSNTEHLRISIKIFHSRSIKQALGTTTSSC
jgi:hypothetical protein